MNAPPLTDTSSTTHPRTLPPAVGHIPCRNCSGTICAAAELITMLRESSVLSLIPSWSFTNALLGALSGAVVEVAHVGGPRTNCRCPSGGSAGAVTVSKFSVHGPPGGLASATPVVASRRSAVALDSGDGGVPGGGVGDGIGGLALGDGLNRRRRSVPAHRLQLRGRKLPPDRCQSCCSVPPATPCTSPGGNVAAMAASRPLLGARPAP